MPNDQNNSRGPEVEIMEPSTRDMSALDRLSDIGGDLVPMGHQTIMMATSREITAKKVAVPRNIASIREKLRVYAAAFGDDYVYSWTVNDRARGGKTVIEGGTIKLANDLLMLYGNCSVDVDIQETPTHILFKAWFIDYESGVALARYFQQRKNQQTGMADKDRAADMVFQIGQSKSERNVVLNALGSLSEFTIEEAKKNLLSRFENPENKKKAQAFIEKVLDGHDIEFKRVEAAVGRPSSEWTVRDLAKVYMEVKGIAGGLTIASDVYPVAQPSNQAKVEDKKDDGGKSGPDASQQAQGDAGRRRGRPAKETATAKEQPAQGRQDSAQDDAGGDDRLQQASESQDKAQETQQGQPSEVRQGGPSETGQGQTGAQPAAAEPAKRRSLFT